jgi:hypothetical protein
MIWHKTIGNDIAIWNNMPFYFIEKKLVVIFIKENFLFVNSTVKHVVKRMITKSHTLIFCKDKGEKAEKKLHKCRIFYHPAFMQFFGGTT